VMSLLKGGMVPQAFLPKIFIAKDRNGEFLSILPNTVKTL